MSPLDLCWFFPVFLPSLSRLDKKTLNLRDDMHNFRRNTCRTWSNSIQEKIQKSKSPSAPSHCLFLTNTNNHPACFLLCRWNILFALIALFKWLARQLCRDRSRDAECESSIPCWVHRVRLNGDELAPVTSHAFMRTPVHAHGHRVYYRTRKVKKPIIAFSTAVHSNLGLYQ